MGYAGWCGCHCDGPPWGPSHLAFSLCCGSPQTSTRPLPLPRFEWGRGGPEVGHSLIRRSTNWVSGISSHWDSQWRSLPAWRKSDPCSEWSPAYARYHAHWLAINAGRRASRYGKHDGWHNWFYHRTSAQCDWPFGRPNASLGTAQNPGWGRSPRAISLN